MYLCVGFLAGVLTNTFNTCNKILQVRFTNHTGTNINVKIQENSLYNPAKKEKESTVYADKHSVFFG